MNTDHTRRVMVFWAAFCAGCVVTRAPARQRADGQETPTSLTLRNDHLRLVLSKQPSQGILSVVDERTGRELTPPAATKPLFVLGFLDKREPGSSRLFLSSSRAESVDASLSRPGKRSVATLVFRHLAGRRVDVTCTAEVRPADPFVHFRLSARFEAPLVLDSVLFPQLLLRVPLDKGEAGAVVLGATKGGVYPRPDQWKPGTRINARQPGSLAAQFACAYGAHTGVFTACRDARGQPKGIDFRRTAAGIATFWTHRSYASRSYRLPYEVVLTTFSAETPGQPVDWRDAATLYKRWALRQPWCAQTYAARTDLPAWMRGGPAMVRFNRSWLANPAAVDRWLHDYWRKFFPGSPPLLTAYWGWEKVDTWVTPDYFPVFPSDQAFTQLTARNKALGCHAFLWPSGYHYTLTYRAREDGTFEWDDRDRFLRSFAQHATRLRTGELFLQKASWLRGGEHAAMCPGDPWTIEWLNHTAAELTKRGAEIIQVDQVVGGSFPPCYSTTHGHPPGPGGWMTEVFHTQLRTMRERCRTLQPGVLVCFEEPNEFFIQDVGLQDYRDWEVTRRRYPRVRPASVFNYLYHEYLPTFQSNPRPHDKREEAYCLVNGEIPQLVPSRRIGPGPALVNGDFEEWTRGVPEGWTRVPGYRGETWRGRCTRDVAEPHSGAACLRLDNVDAGDIVQVSQNVPIGGRFLPGRTYRLSAWMKTGEMAERNALALAALTSDLKVLGGWHVPFPDANQGWVKDTVTFTLPPGSAFLRVMVYVRGKARVWVDDLKLEETFPAGPSTGVQRPETPPDHAFMRRWVELFSGEGRPYLLFGTMLPPPPLKLATVPPEDDTTLDPVLHNAYRAPDGSEAVIMVNATDTPQTGTMDWHGQTMVIRLKPWEVKLIEDR